MSRSLAITALSLALVLVAAPAAFACGGLISPSGTVQLQRTTTFVAYEDGVEHYVTSFDFAGQDASFGSIVPLPDVPNVVERGGDWTLQRAQIEVGQFGQPAVQGEAALAAADDSVEVLLETKVDALDVTILRGGGDEVARWAAEQGFLLSPDAPEVLRFYADRSPIFMAARFDASEATARGFVEGDGIPIHLAIPTDNPWVPLRILGLGKQPTERVEADVFLLTPERPGIQTGQGTTVARQERASRGFLDDLRSDRNSEWIPGQAWFSHVVVDGPASAIGYDLAIDAFGGQPSSIDAGTQQVVTPAVGAPVPFPDAPSALEPGQSSSSAPSDDGGGTAGVALILVSALAGAGVMAVGFVLGQRRA